MKIILYCRCLKPYKVALILFRDYSNRSSETVELLEFNSPKQFIEFASNTENIDFTGGGLLYNAHSEAFVTALELSGDGQRHCVLITDSLPLSQPCILNNNPKNDGLSLKHILASLNTKSALSFIILSHKWREWKEIFEALQESKTFLTEKEVGCIQHSVKIVNISLQEFKNEKEAHPIPVKSSDHSPAEYNITEKRKLTSESSTLEVKKPRPSDNETIANLVATLNRNPNWQKLDAKQKMEWLQNYAENNNNEELKKKLQAHMEANNAQRPATSSNVAANIPSNITTITSGKAPMSPVITGTPISRAFMTNNPSSLQAVQMQSVKNNVPFQIYQQQLQRSGMNPGINLSTQQMTNMQQQINTMNAINLANQQLMNQNAIAMNLANTNTITLNTGMPGTNIAGNISLSNMNNIPLVNVSQIQATPTSQIVTSQQMMNAQVPPQKAAVQQKAPSQQRVLWTGRLKFTVLEKTFLVQLSAIPLNNPRHEEPSQMTD
jgi:hypothetical protein